MNFIEQLFGFSPDLGTGSLEVFLILAAVCWLSYVVWRRAAARAHN